MQNHKRRQYTDAFKQEAVRMITDQGYNVGCLKTLFRGHF
jgi:transposase-like protein